jgi:glycosyltransferase involved in cell wall biosynthesis
MTILVAGGDSFTYGNELADCTPQTPSELTWSAYLAHKLEMKYVCVAQGGWSNPAISRNIINTVSSLDRRGIEHVVVVMWSFPTRFEFRFNYDTLERDSPWYSISPWTHERNQSVILEAFQNFKDNIFNHYKKSQLVAQSTGLADFSEVYYKHIGDSKYWETYSTLKEIVYLQDWLKQRNKKYIFTYVDECIFNKNVPWDASIENLFESLDQSNFYHFPGFYKWAADGGYPFYATHPCESAHTDFVNKFLYEFAQKKFK